jgi:hypothetical protein
MEDKTDFVNARGSEYQHIKGWGVDADPNNNPTYPMKKRTNEEHEGYSWERPPQQTDNIELLKSNERPNITAVFGTSTPPSGLSGKLRRYAFKYSESSYGHWLPLMLADRINVFEGIVDDIKNGHFPNFIAERGWTAEWKYNRENLIKNAAVGVIITSALLATVTIWLQSKRRSNLT